MNAQALAVRAVLGTALAAAIALAPQADAATVKTTSDSCAAGSSFVAKLTLKYETTDGNHHPVSATMASGPYIGDSNTLFLRIFFVEHGETTNVYSRFWRGRIPARLTVPIPDDVTTPDSATSYVSAAFSGGSGALCTAKAEIR